MKIWYAVFMTILPLVLSSQSTFYVSTTGSDLPTNGTNASPWATITYALDQVADGSLILVKPGTYNGRVRMRGSFPNGVEVRSEVPYQAVMRNNDRVFTFYQDARGCHGITLSGFDIAHTNNNTAGLVVHIDGAGDGSVYDITIMNNVLHDSYNNDLLKINNACLNITVDGNMFYNQSGSDEHIDINSVEDIFVLNNVFFNDFAGSGRTNNNNTSSYIVIKDSNGSDDQFLGSKNINIQKNVFLNWEGSTGSNFVLCGEDGHPHFEAQDVLVENNLMLGNSSHVMRAAFGVKGCKNITFRHNTIVGDLPSLAYAFRCNQEGANMVNDGVYFYNNIWSDLSGTMGASFGGSNDFSDTPLGETSNWSIDHNLYWNGANAIPSDNGELINYTDDVNRLIQNPLISTAAVLLPRWNPLTNVFEGGFSSINAAFIDLVQDFATLDASSPARNAAAAAFSPSEDILGNLRTNPDIGAFEIQSCAMISTNTWLGGHGDWYASIANWSEGRFPTSCDHVVIPTSVSITIKDGEAGYGYTLEVPLSSALYVEGNGSLEIQKP